MAIWARDPLLATPSGLAMLHLGDLRATPGAIPPGRINTDDRPLIEFLAPRLTRVDATGDKDWFTGEALAAFADELAAPAEPDAARAAGAALYRYALAMARNDARAAARFEAAVRRLVPDVVAGAEQEAPITTLADARRTLSDLEDEQARVRDRLEAVERRLDALDGRP